MINYIKNTMPKPNNNNQGFTLVEVMIALLLLLAMSLGTLMGLSKTMQHLSRTQYKNEAKQVANHYLAQALAKSYEDLAVAATPRFETTRFWGESNKTFFIEQTVTEPFTDEAKKIEVKVLWAIIDGNEESLTMSSVKGNRLLEAE